MSQYVAYARHACEAYKPQRLVISIVGNDFDESVYANRLRNGFFHLHPRADGGFTFALSPALPMSIAERIGRNSALALYVFRNLGKSGLTQLLSIGRAHADAAIGPYVGNTSSAAGAERVAEGERVVDWFLDTLANSLCVKPRDIVLVVDAMRPEIYAPEKLTLARLSYFGRMRAKLLKDAMAKGFRTVDLETAFMVSFAGDGVRLEPPMDNHWNEKGHAVAAQEVLARLSDWKPLSEARSR